MNNFSSDLNFDEFPPHSSEDWLKSAIATLKGSTFEKLISKTYDNLEVKPIYNIEDLNDILDSIHSYPGLAPYLRGKNAGAYQSSEWSILQELNYFDPSEFNKALRLALENGQNAIKLNVINIDRPEFKYPAGTAINSIKDLECTFENIKIENFILFIDANSFSDKFLPFFEIYCNESNKIPSDLKGGIYYDPIGEALRKGKIENELSNISERISSLWEFVNVFTNFKLLTIDSTIYHDAGSDTTQELAFGLAVGVEYVRILLKLGYSFESISDKIVWKLSSSSDLFLEIAKIRSARLLWSQIMEAFGANLSSRKIDIHSVGSLINKSLLDMHTNTLRSIGETLASVLSGANAITTQPFDVIAYRSNDFSDRIARNIQLIMKHEVHLTDTIDPAGGSYYIENLATKLAEKAWELFSNIEKHGGIYSAIKQGIPQASVLGVMNKKIMNYKTRKDVLLGSNLFINQNDNTANNSIRRKNDVSEYISGNLRSQRNLIPHNLEPNKINSLIKEEFARGTGFIEISNSLDEYYQFQNIEKLAPVRYSEIFEELIFKSKEMKTSGTALPEVYIANFGTVDEYIPRRDFSIDLLSLGGFQTKSDFFFDVSPEGINKAIQDFISFKGKILIICSGDSNYPVLVPLLAAAIKSEKPNSIIILAGKPTEHKEQFSKAGVDEFIHIKMDVYLFLKSLQERLLQN